MKDIIIFLASIVNNIHDKFCIQMTDKELHFWIIGVIGIVTFFFVYSVFKIAEKMKWSITILAFHLYIDSYNRAGFRDIITAGNYKPR